MNALPSNRPSSRAGRRKYGNIPTEVDGIHFDSKKEAARWSDLRNLQRAGHLAALRRQPKFPLEINGELICTYKADFAYRDESGRLCIEDVKGGEATKTPEYKLKRRLMKVLLGIDVIEI